MESLQEGTGAETETTVTPEGGALTALKYMLLCKIMLNLVSFPVASFSVPTFTSDADTQPEDLPSLLSIKLAVRYAQLREVESMRAVARAHQNRNLAEFERALRDYREGLLSVSSFISSPPSHFLGAELSSDPTIRSHLAALYDTLLEQNLLRIVEPYSVVEVEYVAQQVGQERQAVEAKYAVSHITLLIMMPDGLCLPGFRR